MSFIFAYTTLASQFESFIRPVTILLTLLAVPVFYSIWDDPSSHPAVDGGAARRRLFKQNLRRRSRPAARA